MKKVFLSLLIVASIIAVVGAWLLLRSATSFDENKKYLFVYTGKTDKTSVMHFIENNDLLQNPEIFELLANQMDVWKRLKPGRYEIKK